MLSVTYPHEAFSISRILHKPHGSKPLGYTQYMIGFHSLNARDASYLPLIFSMGGNDPQQFRDDLQQDGSFMRDQLLTRGVQYDDLKNALVPTANGRQVAFIYNWWEHMSFNYAIAFMNELLPTLRRDLNSSVLSGDLLDFTEASMPIYALNDALIRPTKRPGSTPDWRTQYCVYFSNLRDADVEAFHRTLSEDGRYGGYLDVTFGGVIRDYLASTLAPRWILHKNRVILGHGSDEPFVGDEDPVGFDLPKYGYEVVSTIDSIHSGYLSYKIESLSASRSNGDRVLSLAAATGEFVDVETAEVFVDPPKIDRYLLRDESKLRLMTSIGLQDIDANGLASVIREKLLQNYIYNMRFATDGTPTFAISGEFEKPDGSMARRLLALKYDSKEKRIALVSMY